MKFEIPVWNGVKSKKFTQKISSLQLRQSHKGIFVQKNKKVIDILGGNHVGNIKRPIESGKYNLDSKQQQQQQQKQVSIHIGIFATMRLHHAAT